LNKEILAQIPLNVLSYRNDYAWIIELVNPNEKKQDVFVKPIKVEISNQWGENRISLASEGVEGPFPITDFQTGRQINVFTVKDNGAGILLGREFVDIAIPISAQGVFLYEKSDFLNYDLEDNKISITKLPSLVISEEIIATDFSSASGDSELISKTLGIYPDQSIFPFPAALTALEEINSQIEQGTIDAANTVGSEGEVEEGDETLDEEKKEEVEGEPDADSL